MTWAPSETQIAVYTTLSGDATLQTLLGGSGRVFDHVPDNTAYPYVTILIFPWDDRGNYTSEGLVVEFQVSAWVRGTARGNKGVQAIQKRIDELLHKANLSITGWRIISLRRGLIDVVTEDDNVTKQGVQRFKLLLGET